MQATNFICSTDYQFADVFSDRSESIEVIAQVLKYLKCLSYYAAK